MWRYDRHLMTRSLHLRSVGSRSVAPTARLRCIEFELVFLLAYKQDICDHRRIAKEGGRVVAGLIDDCSIIDSKSSRHTRLTTLRETFNKKVKDFSLIHVIDG
jgi:hypothetical protein